MFPGPYAQVYYNEAGEPLGWDNVYDEPPDLDEYYERMEELRQGEEDLDEDDEEVLL